jgi:hypothetical protein
MGLEGLRFAFPAIVTTLSTIYVGGLCLLIAWLRVGFDSEYKGYRRIPASLLVFTASVCANLAGWCVIKAFSNDSGANNFGDREVFGIALKQCIWSLFLTISFICLLACMVVARRESYLGKRVLQFGTVVLLIVNVLCLIWYFAM